MRNTILIALVLIVSILLTGCASVDGLFEDPDAKYRPVAVADNELINDVFYVKNATKFYRVYKPDGKVNNASGMISDSQVFWLSEDASLVPEYYKDELIALSSAKTSLNEIDVERFKNIGYSLGIYGAQMDEDGYICFDVNQNVVKGSNAEKIFSKGKSSSIRIISIEDEPVTSENLNENGVILGLTEGESYKIGYYAGTYYTESTITADREFFGGFEYYSIKKANVTKNGYLAINMPEDAESGYYFIEDGGVFKYLAFERGSGDIADADLNTPYYETEMAREGAYTQQYLLSVGVKTTNVKVILEYDASEANEEVKAVLTSPGGTTYSFEDNAEGQKTCSLSEMEMGRWTVNVYPKNVSVVAIRTESAKNAAEATRYDVEIIVPEDASAMQFTASYEGDGDIWGTVLAESGEAVDLKNDEREHVLTAEYAYLPAGTYTVQIYHYADTKIEEVKLEDSGTEEEEEIVIIE